MPDNFPANLSLLCSYLPSVAEVCRQLGINRQQFNKYLNGQSRPSRANMRRICDFFGVNEAEVMLESSQFESLLTVRSLPGKIPAEPAANPFFNHLERISRHSQNMDAYLGYYYRYHRSFSDSGKITRSFGNIYKYAGQYYWKYVELMRDIYPQQKRSFKKYEGVVYLLGNRIYILEYEPRGADALAQVILYPSHYRGIGRLLGLQMGTPAGRGCKPCSGRVVFEYLGRQVDLRKTMKSLGFFHPDDPRLPGDIGQHIDNLIDPASGLLEVDEP